jgi:hypothetical protein
LQEPRLAVMAVKNAITASLVYIWPVRPVNGVTIRKYIVIIEQVVEPCLRQTNYVK